jgi:5-methylcytosine-specific restriction enzyme subunit McrC
MKIMDKYYYISEYGYIANKKNTSYVDKGSALVPEKIFNELENFVLKNKTSFEENECGDFISIAYKNGIGKILKSQNYVGLIRTKSGTTIEILPKIYDSSGELSYAKTLKIFLKMLKYLKNSPFKRFNMSNVKTSRMNLLDVFIYMFLDELNLLLKKGLKSKYIPVENNLFYYKGKLDIAKQIRYNMINKERFYAKYNEYSQNIPENMLIKSTLLYLKSKTNNINIQNSIMKYLFILDEIQPSQNINSDFSKCVNNRLMNDYDTILNWCKIFLQNKSFTNYNGNSNAYSLLFPMEKIFESYVAKYIKSYEEFNNYKIYTQYGKYYLIENPKMFKLKPDIVIYKPDNSVIILDTKWKLINKDSRSNYGISQSDLYQMYAYSKKYNSNNIILLYPKNNLHKCDIDSDISMLYESNIRLYIFFVDLNNTEESIIKLSNLIKLC